MNKRIEELNALKQEVLEHSCQENGHQYGYWTKNEETGEYSRKCTKCNSIETIKSIDPISDIEEELKKQEKGNELLNYLCNTPKETLTPENIIFYLWKIKDYLSYIDLDTLQARIKEVNAPLIDSLNEYHLINTLTSSIYQIHSNIRNASDTEWEQYDKLWEEIDAYVKAMIPQTKSPSR